MISRLQLVINGVNEKRAPMNPPGCNTERWSLYRDMFGDLIRGCAPDAHTSNVRANLMIDIRWTEVPRAFARCLVDESQTAVVRPLARDFEELVGQAATMAFGTRSHAQIPSWFLQNYECFLVLTLHELFVRFDHADCERPYAEGTMASAFDALLDVAEGIRSYVGLHYLSGSTGAHVLMSAVANAKFDILKKVNRMWANYGRQLFVDMLARKILDDPNHALEAGSAFCFFARSERWRAFAKTCDEIGEARWGPGNEERDLSKLLEEVGKATERKPESEPEPGLFFLASEFLDADASPERAVRVERAASLNKASRACIAKRSAPFLRLVRRLVSGTE